MHNSLCTYCIHIYVSLPYLDIIYIYIYIYIYMYYIYIYKINDVTFKFCCILTFQ